MKEKLIRPIFRFFNSKTKNAEIYINNGSVWLIFTNEKRWVFELTKEGTLWYNYYFFDNIFKFFSLNVVENQDYITEWVENFIQNGVKQTQWGTNQRKNPIEDTIQNGVKETYHGIRHQISEVEDTIQNGVKETKHNPFEDGLAMEEAIQNGIKQTCGHGFNQLQFIEDTIQNGVKHTEYGDWLDGDERFDDIIKNGVKETNMEEHHRLREVVQTVKDGVKETNPHFLEILNPINFEPVIKEMKRMNEVNIVLDKGIKEVKELPDKSGELKGYGDYYHRQEDRTKPHTKYVDDVITNGIKKTKAMDEWVNTDRIVDGVIRDGIKETKYCELHSLMRADHIIRDGIKETHWKRVDNHPTFVDSIIQTKNPS